MGGKLLFDLGYVDSVIEGPIGADDLFAGVASNIFDGSSQASGSLIERFLEDERGGHLGRQDAEPPRFVV